MKITEAKHKMPLIVASAVPIRKPTRRPVRRVIIDAIQAESAVPITTVAAGSVTRARCGANPGSRATAGAAIMNSPRPVPNNI